MVLLGVLAIRLQGLNKTLEWDGENMRFNNISPSEELKIISSSNFQMKEGNPKFNKKYETFNAISSANEYIRHTYREGWNLPVIP